MPQYIIEGYIVQSSNEIDARRILGIFLENNSDRVILIQKGSENFLIEIGNEPIKIFTKNKKRIEYHGTIQANSGDKLLETAIKSIDFSNSELAKISIAVKRVNQAKRVEADKNDIVKFESTIPEIAHALYSSIMSQIDAQKDAYKLEIIQALTGVNIKPENWMPILIWFRDKVLETNDGKDLLQRNSFFQLRKAFVTAATRIAKNDVKNGNTMRYVKDDGRSQVDWVKYAKEQEGS